MFVFFIDILYGIFSSYYSLPTSLIRLVSYTASSDLVSRTDALSDDCQFVAPPHFVPVTLKQLWPVAFRIYGDKIQGSCKQRNVYSQYVAQDIMFLIIKPTRCTNFSNLILTCFIPVVLDHHHHHHHHHHHMSVMQLGHSLTRSVLTYLEVSSEVCHDSFCQLGNSVSLNKIK